MTSATSSVVQFVLPFQGMRDLVRNIAGAGVVYFTPTGLAAILRDEISDVIVIRALRNCELRGRARHGVRRGEWKCVVSFNAKGFRPGGWIELTTTEGRIFVENITWDHQP